jgi:catechol 2,3-dioxygenase-like lactoylglutathione lyase family enzyme
MIPRARSMIAATYVSDIDASRAFYRLLGFCEHSSGKAEASAWSVMQHEGVSVLLASTGPALDIPALPLLFYFFYDDVEAVVGVLEEAGVPVMRTGHPPHALGGEVKVLDADGNTVLLGQMRRVMPRARSSPKDKCDLGRPLSYRGLRGIWAATHRPSSNRDTGVRMRLRKPGVRINGWPRAGSRVPAALVQDRAPDRRAAATRRPTPAAGIRSTAVISGTARVGGGDRTDSQDTGKAKQ